MQPYEFSFESQQDFVIPPVNSVLKWKNSLRYFGSVVWNSPQNDIRNTETVGFKSKICLQNSDSCTCRLGKEYLGGVGFIITVTKTLADARIYTIY